MAVRGITVLGVFALHLVGAGCPRPALGQAAARAGTGPDSVVLVPNPRYGAGWFRRLLLGDHHRDLWTLPVKVEVLDLDRFAGGLAPRCRGGGLQTASLQFGSEDGRQYVFRSADEDPTNALLPTALRRTFVAEVLQDQMSSHHPAGAVVVAPLLAAVGVLHAEPELRVMPDHARLGEFRHPFAGMLGTIEERPRAGFAAADQVEGTETIWALIERSSDDQVDPRAYFRARLIDLLVGDWDRHYDQWTWAAYLTDGRRLWRPIPRDHDQAFARLDGLILSAARPFVPQLQSFGPSYPSVYGLTWSARALDRRFLVVLEKQAWDSVVGAVQQRLTDAVLADAVSRMPGEMHGAYGARLLEALKQRRDRLPEAGHRFYLLLAQFADVHATDQDDSAFVERLDDSRVRVRLWRRGGGRGAGAVFRAHVPPRRD